MTDNSGNPVCTEKEITGEFIILTWNGIYKKMLHEDFKIFSFMVRH